jgi:hypothetical protein
VPGKTHPTINADLGMEGEEVTKEMVAFVKDVTAGAGLPESTNHKAKSPR